ncbi:MAG: hypothetical protein ABSB25_03930 [Sedimentisphaerales bacterium]|jgi:hypothetical protein
MEIVNQQNITLVTAIIGAVCGISGMILGIINTWHQISKNRVRLKIIPKIAFMIGANNVLTFDRYNESVSDRFRKGIPFRLCIEVINLSAFPLTISDIGFGKTKNLRHTLFCPELTPGKTWPPRLESRESVVAYAKIGQQLDPKVMNKAVAYASTDCGVTCYGTSPIFKEYVRDLHLKS